MSQSVASSSKATLFLHSPRLFPIARSEGLPQKEELVATTMKTPILRVYQKSMLGIGVSSAMILLICFVGFFNLLVSLAYFLLQLGLCLQISKSFCFSVISVFCRKLKIGIEFNIFQKKLFHYLNFLSYMSFIIIDDSP